MRSIRMASVVAAAALALGLGACSGGGSGSGTTATTTGSTQPAVTAATATTAATTTAPAATSTTAATGSTQATTPPQRGVTAGAFCSPEGGRGVTSAGTAMVCIRGNGDDRARWRQA